MELLSEINFYVETLFIWLPGVSQQLYEFQLYYSVNWCLHLNRLSFSKAQ